MLCFDWRSTFFTCVYKHNRMCSVNLRRQSLTSSACALVLTGRHGDAIALWVQQTSNLCQLTVALDHILNRSGLHEEGIVAFALYDAVHPVYVGNGKHTGTSRLHEAPHALVCWEVWVLQKWQRKDKSSSSCTAETCFTFHTAELEVISAVLLKLQVLWNVMLCLWFSSCWRSEGLCCITIAQNVGNTQCHIPQDWEHFMLSWWLRVTNLLRWAAVEVSTPLPEEESKGCLWNISLWSQFTPLVDYEHFIIT